MQIVGECLHFKPVILFPQNPFDKRKPDESFEAEYHAVIKTNLEVLLFDLDSFLENGHLKIPTAFDTKKVIYRGWMLTVQQYSYFYECLHKQNYQLINTPKQYENTHYLPCWYPLLKQHTPFSIYTEGVPSLNEIKALLPKEDTAIIVKDYVKSRKHEWADACCLMQLKL